MSYIGKTPTIGNFQKCDAISVVNGQATYGLTVNSVAVYPESANHVLCSLNGILQAPQDSFTISSSNIVFASNLVTGDVIDFVMILGNVLDLGVPSDNTVSASKLTNDIISGQTELTVAPASTDELLISDNGTIKRIDVSLVGGNNTPSFEAQLNGNQTVSNDVSTKMEFDTETFDTDNMYDATTNYRFTPTVAGKYYVYCKAEHYGGTTNALNTTFLQIKKNGSTHINSEHSSYPDHILHKIFIYNAGIIDFNGSSDYVEAFIQSTGANATQELKFNNKTTLFGAFKLIGV